MYCISGVDSIDRRINVRASAAKLGWNFEFFPAVFPPANHEEFDAFRACLKFEFNKNLIKGEVGVALSHLLLWERLAKSEMDFFVVFEDDARFVKPPSELKLLMNVDYQMINRHSNPHKDSICIGPNSSGLYGYVVFRSGAQKFLKTHKEIDAPIDIMILRDSLLFGGQLRVAVTETIVEHDDEIKSEIGNARIVFSGRSK